MRRKLIGAILALVGVTAAFGCVEGSNTPGPVIEVKRADLDTALAAALAQDREVDFPERIRFDALRFHHVAGLGIHGRARFFDPATGGYPGPVLRFTASVPMGWWRVEDGSVTINLASVDGIEPIPGGAAPDSPESDRIRDSLGTGIGHLLSRMAFPTGLDPNRDWIIGSSQGTPDALRFELRPG